MQNVREDDQESMSVISVKRRQYYLLPSFYLIHGSKTLLSLVLNVMGSWVSEVSSSVDRSTTICRIASLLLLMYKDIKVRQTLSSCKIDVETMLQKLLNLLVRMWLPVNILSFFSFFLAKINKIPNYIIRVNYVPPPQIVYVMLSSPPFCMK